MSRQETPQKPMHSRAKRLWRELPRDERRHLRGFFRSLEKRYGLFQDRVVLEQARLVSELWLMASQASGVAIEEGLKRRHGRGRRPSLQAFDRRLKRQGLGVESYDKALRRLEELVGSRNGHPDLAQRLASLSRGPS